MKTTLFLAIAFLLLLPKEAYAHDHCHSDKKYRNDECHFFEKTVDAIWSPWGGFAAGFLVRKLSEGDRNNF